MAGPVNSAAKTKSLIHLPLFGVAQCLWLPGERGVDPNVVLLDTLRDIVLGSILVCNEYTPIRESISTCALLCGSCTVTAVRLTLSTA